MKIQRLLFSTSIVLVLMSSCMNTRYITEQYIKTQIEEHKTKEFSTIKTFSIFQGSTVERNYLEFTGYKYNDKKGLVIGADKYYLARQKFVGDKTFTAEITYIELNMEECQGILDNYQVLLKKISSERPKNSEEIYHDYTVSKDLFISYRKSVFSDMTYIFFWIKGEKYTIQTATMLKNLKKLVIY